MSEHASDLVLDELAAGLATASTVAEHVRGCPRCSGRLESFASERRATLAAPAYRQTLAALRAAPARPAFWRRWTLMLPLVASMAAAGAFLLVPRPADRIKGQASLSLVQDGTLEPVTGPVRPGEHLALVVGAAGARQLLVMALGDDGSVAKLWPLDRPESAPAPKGAAARLSPPFVVTPGSATLLAFFSERPLSSGVVESALVEAIAVARKSGAPPSEINLPTLPGEAGRARLRLCVEGSPCSQ